MIKLINKENYNDIVSLALLANEKFTTNSISNGEIIYGYVADEKIIGFIQIYNNYETLEIINLAVEKSKQNKGIGTKLLNEVIEVYKPSQVILEVRETNLQGINFYQKNLFKQIRLIKNYYGNINGIVMERKFK